MRCGTLRHECTWGRGEGRRVSFFAEANCHWPSFEITRDSRRSIARDLIARDRSRSPEITPARSPEIATPADGRADPRGDGVHPHPRRRRRGVDGPRRPSCEQAARRAVAAPLARGCALALRRRAAAARGRPLPLAGQRDTLPRHFLDTSVEGAGEGNLTCLRLFPLLQDLGLAGATGPHSGSRGESHSPPVLSGMRARRQAHIVQ